MSLTLPLAAEESLGSARFEKPGSAIEDQDFTLAGLVTSLLASPYFNQSRISMLDQI